MKKEIIYLTFFVTIGVYSFAQEITTNSNAVSMEHNILFNAYQRYSVTQNGTAIVSLDKMFDSALLSATTTSAPSFSEPTVILIENLPNNNTQQGAWIGWSSRVWYPTKFKIENQGKIINDLLNRIKRIESK